MIIAIPKMGLKSFVICVSFSSVTRFEKAAEKAIPMSMKFNSGDGMRY